MRAMSQNEKRVLLLLLDGWRHETNVSTFRHLAITLGIKESHAKRACRSLKTRGLVEHSPFWCEYDGLLGGSGYTLTCAGHTEAKFNEEKLRKEVMDYAEKHKPRVLQNPYPEGTSLPLEVLHEAPSTPQEAPVLEGERGVRRDDIPVDHWRHWYERLDRAHPPHDDSVWGYLRTIPGRIAKYWTDRGAF